MRGTAVTESSLDAVERLTDRLGTTRAGSFDPLLPIAHDVGATRRTKRPFATKLDHLGPSEHRSAVLLIADLLSKSNGCRILWANDAHRRLDIDMFVHPCKCSVHSLSSNAAPMRIG